MKAVAFALLASGAFAAPAPQKIDAKGQAQASAGVDMSKPTMNAISQIDDGQIQVSSCCVPETL